MRKKITYKKNLKTNYLNLFRYFDTVKFYENFFGIQVKEKQYSFEELIVKR